MIIPITYQFYFMNKSVLNIFFLSILNSLEWKKNCSIFTYLLIHLFSIISESISKILTSDYHNAKRKFMDTTPNNTKRLCASTSLHHNTDANPIYISDPCPSSGFSLSEERCCPIIGCGIKMSSVENFEFHMMSPLHSPCNPFQNILDSSLPDTVIFYLCPKCGQQFKVCISTKILSFSGNYLFTIYTCTSCDFLRPKF